MLDVQEAVQFFKTDKHIQNISKLAAKLGKPVTERDVAKHIEYLNKAIPDTEPEEVFYFVYTLVINEIVYGLQKYFRWTTTDAIGLSFHILEDSNAHTEAKAIHKYYVKEVYDLFVDEYKRGG